MDRLKISLIFTVVIIAVLFFSIPVFAARIKIATKAPENFKSAKIVKKMTKEIEEKSRIQPSRFESPLACPKSTFAEADLLHLSNGDIAATVPSISR